MIARAKRICTHQDRFLEMLPQIRLQARHAFRNQLPSRRQELITEVVANCWVAYVRLIERGLHDVIYASPLARFAIKQVRAGRRVGTKLNVQDVSSGYCQRAKGVKVERLDVLNDSGDAWKEVVVEDPRESRILEVQEETALSIEVVVLDELPEKRRFPTPAYAQDDEGQVRSKLGRPIRLRTHAPVATTVDGQTVTSAQDAARPGEWVLQFDTAPGEAYELTVAG